ncbi:MAG: hypothetical protein IKK34_01945 [Clostridia bacterium]|nr:hypothetical protein [Clostridia bacterium]
MDSILAELYHGRLYPDALPLAKEQEENLSAVSRAQEEMLSILDEKAADMCKRVWEEMNAASARDCEIRYIQGMRMGARLTMELLGDEK